MMIIDCQVHPYAANTPQRPWAGSPGGHRPHVTGDEMVVAMDAVGVDGAIAVSSKGIYGYDASYQSEVQKAHPDRFGIVRPVDPDNPAVGETIAEWKRTPGTVAVRLMVGGQPDLDPATPGIDAIMREAARQGFPVNFQCGGNLDVAMKIIDRHPNTRFALDHLASHQPRKMPDPAAWAALPKILELARENKNIMAVTAAMPEGTGLDKFRDKYPDRFFDVGIAEAHAVCFSAGLAKKGKRPVIAVYSTFLQRAYDQLVESAGLQNLPIVLCLDRAGISGEDGVTHQGLFDIVYLRAIPNMVVMAASSGWELEAMLEFALRLDKPCAIRYPKSAPSLQPVAVNQIELAKAEVLREGKDIAIIALGAMVEPALEAADMLKNDGLEACVVNARFVKPLDKELLLSLADKFKYLVTIEDGILDAGFGSAVLEAVNRPVLRLGFPCEFIEHGRRIQLLEKYGLDASGIYNSIKKQLAVDGSQMTERNISL